GLAQIHDKTTQVGRAYEVTQQSTEQWGETAQYEMDQIQASASGKFKRTLATLQAEMAKAGEPFLNIGATIISVLTKILKIFDGFPSGVKKVLAIVGILAAVAGPVIMLTGLFTNLIGQIIKMFGATGTLVARMRPMTAEQRAQQMLAERSSLAWSNQANAAQALAGQLQTLTTAMERVAVAQTNMTQGTTLTGFGNSTGPIGPAAPPATAPVNPYVQLPNGRYRNTA